jgi:hypothetical protein
MRLPAHLGQWIMAALKLPLIHDDASTDAGAWPASPPASSPHLGSPGMPAIPGSQVRHSCLRGFTRHRVTCQACLRGINQPSGDISSTLSSGLGFIEPSCGLRDQRGYHGRLLGSHASAAAALTGLFVLRRYHGQAASVGGLLPEHPIRPILSALAMSVGRMPCAFSSRMAASARTA